LTNVARGELSSVELKNKHETKRKVKRKGKELKRKKEQGERRKKRKLTLRLG
jgi:hypothetical protein